MGFVAGLQWRVAELGGVGRTPEQADHADWFEMEALFLAVKAYADRD